MFAFAFPPVNPCAAEIATTVCTKSSKLASFLTCVLSPCWRMRFAPNCLADKADADIVPLLWLSNPPDRLDSTPTFSPLSPSQVTPPPGILLLIEDFEGGDSSPRNLGQAVAPNLTRREAGWGGVGGVTMTFVGRQMALQVTCQVMHWSQGSH